MAYDFFLMAYDFYFRCALMAQSCNEIFQHVEKFHRMTDENTCLDLYGERPFVSVLCVTLSFFIMFSSVSFLFSSVSFR